MLFTEKELNSCSLITGKNYFYNWIHGGSYDCYDLACKCWSVL